MNKEHILFLGGSGASGIAFIDHYLTLPVQSHPYLTIYGRSTTKLLPAIKTSPPSDKARIVTGQLGSTLDLAKALTPSNGFPKITTAIFVLGSYPTLKPFFTRFFSSSHPTPIADAFESTIVPSLKQHGVRRLMSFPRPWAFSPTASSEPWRGALTSAESCPRFLYRKELPR
jgi:hypothetical protein